DNEIIFILGPHRLLEKHDQFTAAQFLLDQIKRQKRETQPSQCCTYNHRKLVETVAAIGRLSFDAAAFKPLRPHFGPCRKMQQRFVFKFFRSGRMTCLQQTWTSNRHNNLTAQESAGGVSPDWLSVMNGQIEGLFLEVENAGTGRYIQRDPRMLLDEIGNARHQPARAECR